MKSNVTKARLMEIELRMFWDIASAANYIKHNAPDDDLMLDLLQDAEAMVLNTEWPLLRQVIARRLSAYLKKNPKLAALCASSA